MIQMSLGINNISTARVFCCIARLVLFCPLLYQVQLVEFRLRAGTHSIHSLYVYIYVLCKGFTKLIYLRQRDANDHKQKAN